MCTSRQDNSEVGNVSESQSSSTTFEEFDEFSQETFAKIKKNAFELFQYISKLLTLLIK